MEEDLGTSLETDLFTPKRWQFGSGICQAQFQIN